MKVLVATLILLGLMLCVLIANAIYINNVTDSLLQKLEELPDPQDGACLSALLSLQEEWKKHADVIRLSSGFATWDRVEEQMELVVSCVRAGDLFGYQNALTLLKDSLEDLRRHERISPAGWL